MLGRPFTAAVLLSPSAPPYRFPHALRYRSQRGVDSQSPRIFVYFVPSGLPLFRQMNQKFTGLVLPIKSCRPQVNLSTFAQANETGNPQVFMRLFGSIRSSHASICKVLLQDSTLVDQLKHCPLPWFIHLNPARWHLLQR
jgi:hypothetical protein